MERFGSEAWRPPSPSPPAWGGAGPRLFMERFGSEGGSPPLSCGWIADVGGWEGWLTGV